MDEKILIIKIGCGNARVGYYDEQKKLIEDQFTEQHIDTPRIYIPTHDNLDVMVEVVLA